MPTGRFGHLNLRRGLRRIAVAYYLPVTLVLVVFIGREAIDAYPICSAYYPTPGASHASGDNCVDPGVAAALAKLDTDNAAQAAAAIGAQANTDPQQNAEWQAAAKRLGLPAKLASQAGQTTAGAKVCNSRVQAAAEPTVYPLKVGPALCALNGTTAQTWLLPLLLGPIAIIGAGLLLMRVYGWVARGFLAAPDVAIPKRGRAEIARKPE